VLNWVRISKKKFNLLEINIDHFTEFDELIAVSCEVKFNFLILKNTTDCEFFIFSFHEIHTHSSASSNRLFIELYKNLLEMIIKIHDSELIVNKLFINLSLILQESEINHWSII